MLNDFRPPLAEDPAKRIAELEAENAALRARIRQSERFSIFGLSSLFCLVNVALITNALNFDNINRNGNFVFQVPIVGLFLLIFLVSTQNFPRLFSQDISLLQKKIISGLDVLKWMLIPIGVTGLIILMLWGLVSLISVLIKMVFIF